MSTQLVEIPLPAYQRNADNRTLVRRIPYCSALLTGLTARESNEILARAKPRIISKGNFVYSRGQPADTFLLLQSGIVKLSQKGRTGTTVILWLMSVGDCMGNYHHGGIHHCSAEAVDTCGFLQWSSRDILCLCASFPQLSINIDQMLTRRIQELEERFTELASEKVAPRVARLLIRLEPVIGKQTSEGVEMALKREELAQMIGASIFSVSRLLADWTEAGIVSAGRRVILIRDSSRATLAQYCAP